MSTKKERQKIVAGKIENERERLLHVLRETDMYTIALDPLIESYLDIFEVYQTMHLEWKDKGFPTMQSHTNKAGAKNKSKHPLAQQVEVWADKKTKALDYLGLTNKGKNGSNVTGGSSVRKGEELQKPEPKVSQLDAHRNKWRNKA